MSRKSRLLSITRSACSACRATACVTRFCRFSESEDERQTGVCVGGVHIKYKKTLILFLLFVSVLIAAGFTNSPSKRTIRYFNSHRAALEDNVLETIETGRASSKLDITFNYWDGEHPIIEYITVNRGIASASKYYGFFYSFDNEPVSFQNSNQPLAQISETEWTWDGEGDNHGIVRRLDTNWFYFEAEF